MVTPNIDEHGAEVRLTGSRVVLILAALVLFIPDLPRAVILTIFGILLAAGLFMRYEANGRRGLGEWPAGFDPKLETTASSVP